MLCPRCGSQVGEKVRLCPSCQEDKDRESVEAERVANQNNSFPRLASHTGAQSQGELLRELNDLPFAGFWIRFAAVIVDSCWSMLFVALLCMLTLSLRFAMEPPLLRLEFEKIIDQLSTFGWVIVFVIIVIFQASRIMGSPGKLALGLIVTTRNGEQIRILRSFGRELAKILSSLIFFAGYIMAGILEEKQALHDILGGTRVRKKYDLGTSYVFITTLGSVVISLILLTGAFFFYIWLYKEDLRLIVPPR